MKRRLLNLLTLLSLLLCMVTVVLWVRSRSRFEAAVLQTGFRTAWQFTSSRGRIAVERLTHDNTGVSAGPRRRYFPVTHDDKIVLPVLGRPYFPGGPRWFFGSRNVTAVGDIPWQSKGILGFGAGGSEWDLPRPVNGLWIAESERRARTIVKTSAARGGA